MSDSFKDQQKDSKERLSVSFKYTGHPQTDFIMKSETVCSFAQSKYSFSLAEAIRTGAFTFMPMVTMEEFQLSAHAGTGPTPSAFDQWRAGAGPLTSPIRAPTLSLSGLAQTTTLTPARPSTTAGPNDTELIVMRDAFKSRVSEISGHNQKLVSDSGKMVGDIKLVCDQVLLDKLRSQGVLQEQNITVFWRVLKELLTTEATPHISARSKTLKDTYAQCKQLGDMETSFYLEDHKMKWKALAPLQPSFVVQESAAVEDCINGLSGRASNYKKRLDTYELDAAAAGSAVTSIRPTTYAALLTRLEAEPFYIEELKARATKDAPGLKQAAGSILQAEEESHATTLRGKGKGGKGKGGNKPDPKNPKNPKEQKGGSKVDDSSKTCHNCGATGHVAFKDGKPCCPKLIGCLKSLKIGDFKSEEKSNDKKGDGEKGTIAQPKINLKKGGESNVLVCDITAKEAYALAVAEPIPEHGEVSIVPQEGPTLTVDNACTSSIFKDEVLLSGVRACSNVVMRSLGGPTNQSRAGVFEPLGLTALLNPKAPHNLVAHRDLKELGYRLISTDDDEDVFEYTHAELPKLRFVQNPESMLYTMPAWDVVTVEPWTLNPHFEANQAEMQLDDARLAASERDTVEERLATYSKKDQRNMCKAMKAFINSGFGGIQMFERMLQQGTYADWNITPKDFRNALSVFGLPREVLFGRSQVIQPRLAPVRDLLDTDVSKMTKLVLLMDVIFVAGFAFFYSVANPIHFAQVDYLGPRTDSDIMTVECLRRPMKKHFGFLQRRHFNVNTCGCDAESALAKLRPEVEGKGCAFDPRPPGQHVKELEPCVRKLRQMMRGIVNRLAFAINLTLLKYLVSHCVQLANRQLNTVTPDIARTPHELVFEQKLDANAHLTHHFGQRLHITPIVSSNTLDPRGGDCIMVGRDDSKGVLTLFNVDTGRECRRAYNQVTSVPHDPDFIAKVNNLASGSKAISKPFTVSIRDWELPDEDRDESEGGSVPALQVPVIVPPVAALPEPPQPAAIVPPEGDNAGQEGGETSGDEGVEEEPLQEVIYEPLDIGPPEIIGERMAQPPVDDVLDIVARRLTLGEQTPLFAPEPPETLPPPQPQQTSRSGRPIKPIDRMNLNTEEVPADNEGDEVSGEANVGSRERTGPKRTASLYGAEGVKAMVSELQQFKDFGCLTFVPRTSLSKSEQKDARPTFLFSIKKETAEGEFIKIKSRLTSDGSVPSAQRVPFNERGAPKIDTAHLFAICVIFHHFGWLLFKVDHKAAYLRAPQKQDADKPIVYLTPEVAKLWVAHVNPLDAEFLTDKGYLYARLNTAMYGETNADQLFYDKLVKEHTVAPLNMDVNPYDGGCLFKEDLVVTAWTDDILGFAKSQAAKDEYITVMKARFPGLKEFNESMFSHLGLTMNFSVPQEVKITFTHAIDIMAEKAGVTGKASTPATLDAFELNADSPLLPPEKAALYHTLVNTLLYYATHGLWTLLFAFSILSKTVAHPTAADWLKLVRALRFCVEHKEEPLVMRMDELRIHYHADSSHIVHMDTAKGHGGTYISLGDRAPAIWASSTEVKHVTKSTAETEMSAFTEKLPVALHMLRFFAHMGIDLGPIIGHQDNEAAITLMTQGKPCSSRTRHLDMRAFWANQYIDGGLLELVKDTDMPADVLTKPKAGKAFERDAAVLMGHTLK